MVKLDEKGLEAAQRACIAEPQLRNVARAAILAYLKATNSVIVPVEPTLAMIDAGLMGLSNEGVDDANSNDATTCYRAMLQASQESE